MRFLCYPSAILRRLQTQNHPSAIVKIWEYQLEKVQTLVNSTSTSSTPTSNLPKFSEPVRSQGRAKVQIPGFLYSLCPMPLHFTILKFLITEGLVRILIKRNRVEQGLVRIHYSSRSQDPSAPNYFFQFFSFQILTSYFGTLIVGC